MGISERLKGMLVDLISNANAIYDSVEEIREQARSEGFEDYETDLLLKVYLEKGLGKRRAKYILFERPRIQAQKSLTDKSDNIGQKESIPEIPAPDYKVIAPDQVIDEAIAQQEQEPQQQEYKPDYALEDLRSQIENYKSQNEELTTRYKELEERHKQLEAKTRVSPSNQIPALRGNNLRTKVVVSQLFREVLALKGGKMIYANILIDLTQNKYVRLEPL